MQLGGYCFWCVRRKHHQRKWAKTKNDRWRHRNNYFRFWSTSIRGNWLILVCIKSKNKKALQQFFTKFVLNKVKSEQLDKPLFLGGSHKENDAMCVSFVNGLVNVKRLLECTHEEDDDQIFFHPHHAIKIGNYGNVVIASPDTYICICTRSFLQTEVLWSGRELWSVSGRGDSRTFFPIHDLDSDFVEVLPAIHALTGCDTASKVGTKSRAVREGADCYHLLYAFGWDALSDKMIADAEKFLLKCITKHDVDTFSKLRFIVHHKKYLEFDIECFPPTSDNTRQHILHAYLQCYIWLHSAFLENLGQDLLEYDYRLTEYNNLVPITSTKQSIPSNFPQPCNCQKCSKASVWLLECWLLEIRCCQFCKCDSDPRCKNSVKWC